MSVLDPNKALVSTERKALIPMSLSLNNSIDEAPTQSSRAEPILIQIKRNAGSEIQSIDMRKYQELTIYAFKQKYFQKELHDNMVIRIIYEGKQLKDEDKISTIKFKNETFLHAFISKPIVEEQNITVVSAEAFDNDKRGFDKLRAYEIMEEELILFRGKFHSKTILVLKNEMITEQVLFEYEEEWCRENMSKITSPEIARKVIKEYDPGFPEEEGKPLDSLLGCLLGIFLFFLVVLVIIWRKNTVKFRRGAYVGIFVDVCIILVIRFFLLEHLV